MCKPGFVLFLVCPLLSIAILIIVSHSDDYTLENKMTEDFLRDMCRINYMKYDILYNYE